MKQELRCSDRTDFLFGVIFHCSHSYYFWKYSNCILNTADLRQTFLNLHNFFFTTYLLLTRKIPRLITIWPPNAYAQFYTYFSFSFLVEWPCWAAPTAAAAAQPPATSRTPVPPSVPVPTTRRTRRPSLHHRRCRPQYNNTTTIRRGRGRGQMRDHPRPSSGRRRRKRAGPPSVWRWCLKMLWLARRSS